MHKILVASGNQGKIDEFTDLFKDYNIIPESAKKYNMEEPEENGKNFIENAFIKAKYYCKKTGLPSLADDSGISIEALFGAPFIYSAGWCGDNKNFSVAFDKIFHLLGENPPNKKARFTCALCLYLPDDNYITAEGKLYGNITKPRGVKGFGYDPIFIPSSYDKTFAEFDLDLKQQISHRRKAFDKLIKKIKLTNFINLAT